MLVFLGGAAAGAAVGVTAGWILAQQLTGVPAPPPVEAPSVPEDLLPTDSASHIAADISLERRFEELASLLAQSAAARTGLATAVAMREKPGDPVHIVAVSSNNDPRLLGMELPLESPAGKALLHGIPVVAGSDEKVVHLAPGERRRGQHGGISLPIMQSGQAYGAVVAFGVPETGTDDAVEGIGDLVRRFGPALVPAFAARQESNRARSDELTGMPNRRRLADAMAVRERIYRAALILLDLDHFKRINDTLGHQAGDAALKHIAKLLTDTVRRREGDLAARIGGEEFAVWLPGATLDAGLEVAERVRQVMEVTPFRWLGQEHRLTISCGVAAYPEPIRSVDNLMPVADAALYEAKHSGRNRVVAGKAASR
jgi:diguanylate cyclase (GGDEF)-like protein